MNPPLRRDLPPGIRPAFERAGLLLDEAQSIRQGRKDAIERELSPEDRAKLSADLSALRQAMRRKPFDEERFVDALVRADGEVDLRLGRWRKSEVREYIESIVIAVVVAMGLRAFVIEAFKIPSGSMIPTLQVGDHIFVNKFSYGPAIPFTHARLWKTMPPERGDVMVFQFPEDLDEDFIKRVIDPAVLEVNGLSEYGVKVDVDRAYSRAPITGVTLGWWKKPPEAYRATHAERQRSKLGRMARLKGKAEAKLPFPERMLSLLPKP